MEIGTVEYFGNPSQQGLQKRADLLWTLLQDDPAYSCHGRAVAIAEYSQFNLDTQIALTRLQGVSSCENVPFDIASARRATFEAHGLKTDEYVNWRGGMDALDAAKEIGAAYKLPNDLEAVFVDLNTPSSDLAEMDKLTQACGVLLPMGSFLRGERRPSAFLFARDNQGNVVGAAAAVAQFHPDHAKAKKVWWGMLATDPSRRGERIAMILGAQALIAMKERFGYQDFFTGIRSGNTPSEKLCRKLGFLPSDSVDIITIDPFVFAATQLTK